MEIEVTHFSSFAPIKLSLVTMLQWINKFLNNFFSLITIIHMVLFQFEIWFSLILFISISRYINTILFANNCMIHHLLHGEEGVVVWSCLFRIITCLQHLLLEGAGVVQWYYLFKMSFCIFCLKVDKFSSPTSFISDIMCAEFYEESNIWKEK